jgi:hypothetical protein
VDAQAATAAEADENVADAAGELSFGPLTRRQPPQPPGQSAHFGRGHRGSWDPEPRVQVVSCCGSHVTWPKAMAVLTFGLPCNAATACGCTARPAQRYIPLQLPRETWQSQNCIGGTTRLQHGSRCSGDSHLGVPSLTPGACHISGEQAQCRATAANADHPLVGGAAGPGAKRRRRQVGQRACTVASACRQGSQQRWSLKAQPQHMCMRTLPPLCGQQTSTSAEVGTALGSRFCCTV